MGVPGASAARRPSRALDLAAVLTVVPLLVAAGMMIRAAWRSYHPKRRPVRQTPESFGLEAQRVTVEGGGGVALSCWFVPAPADSDAVVVLGHGIGRDSGMLMPLVKALHDAGYHVLTFDLRNHGESGDDNQRRGQSEGYLLDHERVVASLDQRPELGDYRVACLGYSMSAWTSLAVAGLHPERVRAAICDSGPTGDIRATIGRMFDMASAAMPTFLRGPLMSAFCRRVFLRASVFFLQPTTWPAPLKDETIRMLVIGGEADPIARPEDLRELSTWYPQAEYWFVPRAGHMQGHLVAADEYVKRVLEVLEQSLPSPGA